MQLLKQKIRSMEIFSRPDHVEGYLELSAKTKTYFATAVNLWDADFYIKVDDDVHVNIVLCLRGQLRSLVAKAITNSASAPLQASRRP
ncbi:hypothetical protein ACSQ67_025548 [Phaseolus vulgaris]